VSLLSRGDLVGTGRVRDVQARRFIGTDPAAGVEITETVPAGVAWEIRNILLSLVTNATVANRRPTLVIDDGTNDVAREAAIADQAASLTFKYDFAAAHGNASQQTTTHQALLLPELVCLPGWRIRTVTSGLVAGDDYAAPVLQIIEYQVS
jgi:hypothetical protein